jgi:2-isopropylmalate synthase
MSPLLWRTSCASPRSSKNWASTIEGGYPGSNRGTRIFQASEKAQAQKRENASFGYAQTGAKPSQDFNLKVLLEADTPVVTLVGKTWDLHVRDDLRISQKSQFGGHRRFIAYIKRRVDEVIFDAEHFFDGFRANPDYALECLKRLRKAARTGLCCARPTAGACPAGAQALTHVNRVIKTPRHPLSQR